MSHVYGGMGCFFSICHIVDGGRVFFKVVAAKVTCQYVFFFPSIHLLLSNYFFRLIIDCFVFTPYQQYSSHETVDFEVKKNMPPPHMIGFVHKSKIKWQI